MYVARDGLVGYVQKREKAVLPKVNVGTAVTWAAS